MAYSTTNRITVGGQLWTPEFTTTQAWWDASNPDNITAAGGWVSQLDDLSGNGYHQIQPTGSLQVQTGVKKINGLNCVSNADSGTNKPHLYANMLCPNDHMLFIVMYIDIAPFSQGPFSWANVTDRYGGYRFMDQLVAAGNAGSSLVLGTDYAKQEEVMFSFVFDGSGAGTKEVFKNGTSGGSNAYTSITASSTLTDFRLFKNSDQSCQAWIGEALFVPNDVTLETRQKIEGYMAHKWGQTANLPASHPYKALPPYKRYNRLSVSRLWVPGDVPLESHHDASDLSTLTVSGSSISQIDDMTGNGHHWTQETSARQPTKRTENGLNGMNFDGAGVAAQGSDMLITNPFDMIGKEMWCAVIIDSHATNNKILGSAGGAYPTNGQQAACQPTTGEMRIWQGSNDPYSGDTKGPATTEGQFHILGYLYDKTTKKYIRDGALTNTTDTYDGTGSMIPDRVGSGQFDPTLDGFIGEMIITQRTLSTDERHKMAAYLAWKWGTVATLDASNPYRTGRPLYTGGYNRLSIGPWNPSMMRTDSWFDAADLFSITVSGNKITQLDDKSSLNNNHVSQANGALQPFTGVDSLNGLNIISFTDGTQSLNNLAASIDLTSEVDVYFVAKLDNTDNKSVFTYYNTGGLTIVDNNQSGIGGRVYGEAAQRTQNPTNDLLWHIENVRWSGSTFQYFLDATQFGTDVALTDSIIINAIRLGQNKFGGQGFTGKIAEIIMCPYQSELNRKRIEGYLAWKWGLTGNLPSNHIYKNIRP